MSNHLNPQKTYKYETHLHTNEGSACALSTGVQMARAHKAAGYTGMIVTDHFFNGNTAVPARLPWEVQVHQFCRGYERAKKEGKRIGLHVFFGWEYTYHGMDFLTYGLDKEFLLSYPDVLSWPIEEYFDRVHQWKGFISHAHPFREAEYIHKIQLFPHKMDAVEVINGSHSDPRYNERALSYAKEHGLLQTFGSDTHSATRLHGSGMEFHHELYTIHDFIGAVRSHSYKDT